MAAKLFGSYPRNDANDPEIFLTGATATLAEYPEIVVERVCDFVRGLPSKIKFLPSIAEIREACEREMIWHDAVERRARAKIETAKVLASAIPPPTAEGRKRMTAMADALIAALAAKEERKIDFKPPRSPSEAEVAKRHFEARLPELSAEYAAKPVRLSNELRRQLPDEPEIERAAS